MSFDIHLIRFAKGRACELPRESVRAALHGYTFRQLSLDSYDVQFQDGSHVEFDAHGLSGSAAFNGCVFWIRGMSDAIIRFVFEVARAGETVLFPTMEGNPCILVRPGQNVELPPDLDLPLAECYTPEQLGRFVADGYQDWSRYRDHVMRSPRRHNRW